MRRVLLVSIGLLILSSCEEFDIDRLEEFEVFKVPDPSTASNPLDPHSPGFVEPEAFITAGPEDGAILRSTYVIFHLSGPLGNPSLEEFSYRLDGSDWTRWSSEERVWFNYLDEGEHVFRVRCRYKNGAGGNLVTVRRFTVDTVGEPGVYIKPRRVKTRAGRVFGVSVMAKGFKRVMIARVFLRFDSGYLKVVDVRRGNLIAEAGGKPIFVKIGDNERGFLEIDAGAALVPSGINGDGEIAKVFFEVATWARWTTELKFDPNLTTLRDIENKEIELRGISGCRIDI